MRRGFRFPFVLLSVATLLLLACGARCIGEGGVGDASATATPALVPVAIFPSVTVELELARTEAERTRGLGGHAPLGEREGMLFIFERPGPYAFWMKGMTFALDIIWIDAGKVVHLETDVPPSPPHETDATRPVYTPRAAASYVLEVNAGFARRHGIEVGTPVQLAGI